MSKKAKITDLLNFLDNSPTAWHAVANCTSSLLEHGFKELKEQDAWHIEPSGKYFVTRNGSSLCAFIVPNKQPSAAHVIASHTDSPSFKLKPNCEFKKENMVMLACEVYGSPLLSSWLNRDLGIAGRVIYLDSKNMICEELIRLEETPVIIPQLAIHLDRNVNENGLVLNKQEHLAALVSVGNNSKLQGTFLERSLKKHISKNLLSYDLFLYPLEKARLVGEDHNLISSYRIDNLESVYASLEALLQTKHSNDNLLKFMVSWDHEEVGSNSSQGAGSPFLPHIMERIAISLKMSREDYFRLISHSLCTSVDQAHALHPNYPEKHDPRHQPLLNQGIVIKTNAQQRYASDARSFATIAALCIKHKIPFQKFVSRNDIPCGSTVGPITANVTGMPTIDIGCAQLSMHSSRELMGVNDHLTMIHFLSEFINT
ncbi:MAG: M18 family aminopeptidase [Parachlamydiaceae bacterium]|nr:M18 family aminopeptidase [Parachlamydiaceae bacterium]